MRQKKDSLAYESFLMADQMRDQLHPNRRRNLRGLLASLAPRGNLTLIGAQEPMKKDGLTKLQIIDRQMRIKYERMRSDTLNAVFKAERMKERNPQKAMEVIDRAMAAVSGADLPKPAAASLLRQLRRSRGDIAVYMQRRAPLIALQENNDRIKAEIEREVKHKVEIDKQFAAYVEDFNKLFKQRRYAEAEVVAKQAQELQRENPVSQVMFWKARYARRIESNAQLVLDKEAGVWGALDEVEKSAIPFHGNPMQFPKDWAELTKRRRGRYGADNRIRTEEEKRIEQSLSKQVSLHFNKAKLGTVAKHIATVADINVVLDNLGLEDEAVSTDTPISIDVDGIMLKSALKLILRPLNLDYTIQDEVLKITSKMRQQGELEVRTYPVADLVIPIPNFTQEGGSRSMASNGTGISGFGHRSVPSMGMGGGHFQVNDPVAAAANPRSLQPELRSQRRRIRHRLRYPHRIDHGNRRAGILAGNRR